MNKIIVPVGYMGSGSSAITDLLAEFEHTNNDYKTFEYVFLHCPNGIFDLADKILYGNNIIRSDEAIHSFLKTMRELYNKKYWWVGNYKHIVGETFYTDTLKYVEDLVDLSLNNYWYYQENTNFKMFFQLVFNRLVKLITLNKIKLKKPLLYDKMLLCYKTEKEFYFITKKYIKKILNTLDDKNDLILDQLLLPHNLFRIDDYFDDNLRVIVVERDPRDVFILNKYIWSLKKIGVPYSYDVKEFCIQYKKIKEMEKPTKSFKILKIKFEDLIYNYGNTLNQVMKHLGYNDTNHIHKFSRFNPDISIKNTQVFKSDDKFKEEVAYIEIELKHYLYNFPYSVNSKIEDTIE